MTSWLNAGGSRAARLSAASTSFGLLFGPGIGATAASNPSTDVGADGIIEVPSEVATVQEAVDAAEPGDLVLIAPGVYNEAVDVTTDDVTIRGLDRDEVVFDGEFELANGIRVLGASGVAIENLTLGNYSPDVLDPAANDDLRTMRLGANRTVRSCSLRAVARSAGRTRRHDR